MSTGGLIQHMRGIAMRAAGATATRDFYVKNWGLVPVAQENGSVYFRGTGPEQYIYALRDDDQFGVDYVNFAVASRDHVERLHGDLAAKGVDVLGAPAEMTTPGGGFGFMALDPDKRRLRFVTGVALHNDTADDIAKPRKVTHVVLNTPQMERTRDFYTDVLGMRVSDYSAAQMVFLRIAADHHSIALNQSPYPSVNHVAFEMPSIDSFMRGIGRMKTLGQAPAWGPGRHGPGNNPFAYFVSPSGFVIEFTTEVQQIDEATHQPQVWPRDVPEKMDVWMTAGPPTPAMRAVMQGRPDAGFSARS
ncbi:VOC family protein [Rhodoplanes roseus]|uniref:Glyoxalase n=1 Tax=Rhodoplanes roseus TaxID=29409 RepID=A0A327L0A8_9BRAD|nr:VOC family protein [Rhodoplanes roseus]RAI43827.1 glyoxalase [Rhodoplanes roseus]